MEGTRSSPDNMKVTRPTHRPPPDNIKVTRPTPGPPPDSMEVTRPTPIPPPDNMEVTRPTHRPPPDNMEVTRPTPRPPPDTMEVTRPTPRPPPDKMEVTRPTPRSPPDTNEVARPTPRPPPDKMVVTRPTPRPPIDNVELTQIPKCCVQERRPDPDSTDCEKLVLVAAKINPEKVEMPVTSQGSLITVDRTPAHGSLVRPELSTDVQNFQGRTNKIFSPLSPNGAELLVPPLSSLENAELVFPEQSSLDEGNLICLENLLSGQPMENLRNADQVKSIARVETNTHEPEITFLCQQHKTQKSSVPTDQIFQSLVDYDSSVHKASLQTIEWDSGLKTRGTDEDKTNSSDNLTRKRLYAPEDDRSSNTLKNGRFSVPSSFLNSASPDKNKTRRYGQNLTICSSDIFGITDRESSPPFETAKSPSPGSRPCSKDEERSRAPIISVFDLSLDEIEIEIEIEIENNEDGVEMNIEDALDPVLNLEDLGGHSKRIKLAEAAARFSR